MPHRTVSPDTEAVADFCRNDQNGVGTFQAIAENVQRVEFNYLDADGATIPAPITSNADRNRIRSVQVSMLVRASRVGEGLLQRRYLYHCRRQCLGAIQ